MDAPKERHQHSQHVAKMPGWRLAPVSPRVAAQLVGCTRLPPSGRLAPLRPSHHPRSARAPGSWVWGSLPPSGSREPHPGGHTRSDGRRSDRWDSRVVPQQLLQPTQKPPTCCFDISEEEHQSCKYPPGQKPLGHLTLGCFSQVLAQATRLGRQRRSKKPAKRIKPSPAPVC